MPLPKPTKKQNKKEFLNSCMANPVMNNDFKDNKQRYAVCNSLWEKHLKKNNAEELDFDEVMEEEKKCPVWIINN